MAFGTCSNSVRKNACFCVLVIAEFNSFLLEFRVVAVWGPQTARPVLSEFIRLINFRRIAASQQSERATGSRSPPLGETINFSTEIKFII